jgi:cobalt-zinc-cadmium efflux system membrane fusion protein
VVIEEYLDGPEVSLFCLTDGVDVVPRVAGVVEAVPVALGQQVRRGQVLAVISSPTVSEQRAALQAAQARHQLARSTYEREKTLWEEKISPQQDVLQAENALREAEIAVDNARQKLQAVGAGGTGHGTGNLTRFELRAPFDGTVV